LPAALPALAHVAAAAAFPAGAAAPAAPAASAAPADLNHDGRFRASYTAVINYHISLARFMDALAGREEIVGGLSDKRLDKLASLNVFTSNNHRLLHVCLTLLNFATSSVVHCYAGWYSLFFIYIILLFHFLPT